MEIFNDYSTPLAREFQLELADGRRVGTSAPEWDGARCTLGVLAADAAALARAEGDRARLLDRAGTCLAHLHLTEVEPGTCVVHAERAAPEAPEPAAAAAPRREGRLRAWLHAHGR